MNHNLKCINKIKGDYVSGHGIVLNIRASTQIPLG